MEQDIEKVYKLKINKLEEENSKLQENNEEIKEKFLRNIEETEKLKKQLQSNIRVFNKTIDEQNKKIKELEEENKIIKGNYYTLCADIQMVTSELGFPEDTIIADEMVSMIKENYIPVSLVEEKILNPMKEEHDKAIKGFIKRDIPQCIEDGGIAQELGYFIGKIEELLEKRK